MKFAQRISSIRRIASNAWRRCSPASASMWPASEASSALAGWIVSPRAASSDVTGSWASHSTTRPGTRRRSSSAIRTSRHACPSPIGDETTSARRGCEAGRAHRAGIRGAARDVAQEEVHPDGVAHERQVPRALEDDEPAARELGHARAALGRHHLVRGALDHDDGAAHRAAQRLGRLPVRDALLAAGHGQDLRRGVEPPRDAVLERLRRVRLGQRLREEELEEAPEVLLPVLGVVLGPAAIAPRRLVGEVGHRRAERDHRPRTRSGCSAASSSA